MIKPFNNYILRTSLRPFILPEISDNSLDSLYFSLVKKNNQQFSEALYLSSSTIFSELENFNANIDCSYKRSILNSVFKYSSRAAHRCTPFGMMAGFECSGEIGNCTKIEKKSKIITSTRLDMNLISSLAKELSSVAEIRANLTFTPNNSIYFIGDAIRYIEYSYNNSKRVHKLVEVENNNYLELIIKAQGKLTINKIIGLIREFDDEISVDEAAEFIEELISSQFLISELEPSITGGDFQEQLLASLQHVSSKIKDSGRHNHFIENIIGKFTKIKKFLAEIDIEKDKIGKFEEIKKILKSLEISYDKKYLFQTDSVFPTKSNTLSSVVVDQVIDGIYFLKRIINYFIPEKLKDFTTKFRERYEDNEIKLLEVIDSETGIGYGNTNNDQSLLIDDLIIPSSAKEIPSQKISPVEIELLNLLKNNPDILDLTDETFKSFKKNNKAVSVKFCSTFSAMIKLVNEKQILLDSVGGTSAKNLIGRFCSTDHNTLSLAKEVARYEEEYYKGKIIAEIIHLPEARTGNILLHPKFHNYEIPFLAKESVKSEYKIDINDLYLQIKGDYLVLKSKKLNMEIIPRLSNAHNYSYNSLPLYNFLCDMQTQTELRGISFTWGTIETIYDDLPRVTYKNLIFSPAQWKIKKEHLEEKLNGNKKSNIEEFIKLKRKRKIPDKVLLTEGDNTLLLDLTSDLCINLLIEEVKKKSECLLKEFLFNAETAIVRDQHGQPYTNEIILAFRESGEFNG